MVYYWLFVYHCCVHSFVHYCGNANYHPYGNPHLHLFWNQIRILILVRNIPAKIPSITIIPITVVLPHLLIINPVLPCNSSIEDNKLGLSCDIVELILFISTMSTVLKCRSYWQYQLGANHVCVILSRRRDTITSVWYYVSHRRDTSFQASFWHWIKYLRDMLSL